MIDRMRNALRRRRALAGPTDVVAVQPEPVTEVRGALRLADIPLREMVELVSIDLPSDELEPLLELGVMPGCTLCPVRNSPFGDPVLLVDGSLIAVRREMARCLCVRRGGPAAN